MGKLCSFALSFFILVTSDIIVCEDICSLQVFKVKLYENERNLKRIINWILEHYCGFIRVEVCKSNLNTIFQKTDKLQDIII